MKINIFLKLDKSQVEGMALLEKFSKALEAGEDILPLLKDRLYVKSFQYSMNNANLGEGNIYIQNLTEK